MILFKTLQLTASICSENETPAKTKKGLNKIYKKYKEYDTYKEAIEDIKTVEINGFGMVYRRPANDQHDQHEYVCPIYPNRSR